MAACHGGEQCPPQAPGGLGASGEERENLEQQKLELEALLSIYPEEISVVKEDTEYLVGAVVL